MKNIILALLLALSASAASLNTATIAGLPVTVPTSNTSGYWFNDGAGNLSFSTPATVLPLTFGQSPASGLQTTLSASALSTDTSITVGSTTNYPVKGVLLVDSEAMSYTGITATSFTGLTRGALQTTAAAHSSAANVYAYTFIASPNGVTNTASLSCLASFCAVAGAPKPGSAAMTLYGGAGAPLQVDRASGDIPISFSSNGTATEQIRGHSDGTGVAITNGTSSTTYADLKSTGASLPFGATIGANGTAIAKLAKYTASLTPAAVAANTCAEQTFTVTGIAATDIVYGNKPTAQAGLGVSGVRASATNTVGINYCNVTAASITPTAETYSFGVIQ